MRHGLRSLAIAAGAIAGASGGLVSRPHAFSASAPAAISRRASSVHASVAISKPPLPEVVERAPATHPAFELVRVEMVDEYTIKVATYRHRQSGAEVISAQADDENKVFGIAFRTPVEDSTGVPHILEHSVLCGSAKYTSKEPFTELLKGSLQTFLNAFTYPDRTCYPVASCNTKDFYNLVNVYLDAVLSPRAKRDPTVFAQEGWHYELDAAEEPLTYKGAICVVFNEMKGVYSSPDSLLYRAAQQATFPDNTYAKDSGGDPDAIVELTFDQFKRFHDAYYHPSNSRIFFYGDDPLEARRDRATPAASRIETQAKFATPRRVVERFPASADEAAPGAPSHMVMLNWLLNEKPLSPVDALALTALALRTHTLRTHAHRALHFQCRAGSCRRSNEGLASRLSPPLATFSVGLKGVAKEDVPKVEALALETLAAAAKDGFEADAVEATAAVNTLEFQLREMNTGGFPKGLAFMLSMLPRWIYRDDEGANVADALRFEAPLAELKTKLASGEKVFEPLLASLLVDNGHLATIEMVPDASLAEEWAAKERSRLEAAKAAMGEEELADVIRSTADLKRAQLAEDSAEDLATIPRVGLADLEAKACLSRVPTDVSALSGGVPLLTHPLPCAGVVYADVLLDLQRLPAGTSELDATALQRRIGARTGGIDVGTKLEQPVGDSGAVGAPDGVVHKLVVRGKAVRDRLPDMLELVHSMLTDANLDAQPKAVELLKESKSRLEAAFLSSGNSFAGMRLSSRNTAVGYATELTSGVSYYEAIKEMLTTAQDDWPSLLARLERLRGTINARDGLMINLTSDPDAIDGAKPQLDAFVGRMPAAPAADAHGEDASKWSRLPLAPREDEAYAIVSQVNYVAAGCRLFEPGEIADFGAASVASRALSLGYLWDNVRVAGGAYGGGCALNPTSGGFAFSSYRDPNLQATLDIYAAAADALSESDISAEALEQAIVGMVGDLDKPLTPDQKGQRALNWHLTGVTTAMRQEFRDQVLGCSPEAFRAFAERLRKAKLSVSVFGSEEALAAANAKRETPLPVKKIV
ncbi:peptidase M16 [Emiliania huxleyi CCMP1516]|uniref:Peptidase M16C associated domain-containing protein n=2 Tax=Emiliania huxleyi TaxID=2903 RepID=A0A0D3IC62_EMIH1|nr:peptidase M16 [Emiliania huxleyi CCMP1516]EOD08847.1 peptidase M16 [Emiliania huxleyi CCMP1516]|eukprot:XP_005761276.1 peptidase M16 [Emiliania huxleyi CCMP1516]